ncbi:hypothetical protein RHGRI_009897 [Rhododendron griersonianum]|uniref:F-box domain-containing protein n=1 Tax=Rhododendron griersonianum TaxID=479676 RepID=A0AAV6KH51_9ERIC|nr:hypothetical protein RHGRI_009897 [Rhododendron griersonianum]
MGNPELPTPLVIDILSRLPIKTLFDFRRVCKDWLSLISDPYFANLHLSKSHVGLFFETVGVNPEKTELKLNLVDIHISPSPPRNASMELVTKINLPKGSIPTNIIGSCNGLLCLGTRYSDGPICVCNPLLCDLVTLPNCPSGRSISSFSCAFGYSPMTDQYKVVRCFGLGDVDPVTGRETCEAEIYTLGEGSWRSIGKIPARIYSNSINSFLNGSLHWVNLYLYCIYCFDFGSEQLRPVPKPSEFGTVQGKCGYLLMRVEVVRGCLSVCNSSEPDHAEVWVMKDYGVKESWCKDFVIDTRMIDNSRRFFYYEPFMVLDDGQMLIFGYNSHSIFHYDSKSKCVRKVHGYGPFYIGLAHIPSLLSLRDIAKGENFEHLLFLNSTIIPPSQLLPPPLPPPLQPLHHYYTATPTTTPPPPPPPPPRLHYHSTTTPLPLHHHHHQSTTTSTIPSPLHQYHSSPPQQRPPLHNHHFPAITHSHHYTTITQPPSPPPLPPLQHRHHQSTTTTTLLPPPPLHHHHHHYSTTILPPSLLTHHHHRYTTTITLINTLPPPPLHHHHCHGAVTTTTLPLHNHRATATATTTPPPPF